MEEKVIIILIILIIIIIIIIALDSKSFVINKIFYLKKRENLKFYVIIIIFIKSWLRLSPKSQTYERRTGGCQS